MQQNVNFTAPPEDPKELTTTTSTIDIASSNSQRSGWRDHITMTTTPHLVNHLIWNSVNWDWDQIMILMTLIGKCQEQWWNIWRILHTQGKVIFIYLSENNCCYFLPTWNWHKPILLFVSICMKLKVLNGYLCPFETVP